jgi:hypothetical protein
MVTAAMPGEQVLTALRKLISVLAQAPEDGAVAGGHAGAERLYVVLAGLSPRGDLRLNARQPLLTRGGQLARAPLQAGRCCTRSGRHIGT